MIAWDRMCVPMCDCKLMFFSECAHDYVYICLKVFVWKNRRSDLAFAWV